MRALPWLLLAACTPKGDDTAAPSDTAGDSGTDSQADSGADTSADTSADTGADTGDSGGDTAASGLLTWNGYAQVTGAYSGTEDILLLGDLGLGATDCDIQYTVQSTSALRDCDECAWAYDVVLGGATVVSGDHCVDAGYDAATIAAIGGTHRGYGLALDFMGHGNALMLYTDGRWGPVALVDWSESDGQMNYEWAQGYLDY